MDISDDEDTTTLYTSFLLTDFSLDQNLVLLDQNWVQKTCIKRMK